MRVNVVFTLGLLCLRHGEVRDRPIAGPRQQTEMTSLMSLQNILQADTTPMMNQNNQVSITVYFFSILCDVLGRQS